jgi:D-alanine-D-alanine ligase-like ATP-grasp enzyme
MCYLPTEEVFYEGVTEAQREILREIYTRTVQMSKTGLPVKRIIKAYQFYDIKNKNVR